MARRKYPSPRKPGALLLTLVLLALALTGATLAYLITHTDGTPAVKQSGSATGKVTF